MASRDITALEMCCIVFTYCKYAATPMTTEANMARASPCRYTI